MEKIIIVGSGPAGCTAALYTARANLSPLVLEGLEPGGQLTTTTDVENYPGFTEPINGFELVDRMKRQAERFGARFVPAAVTSSDFSRRPHRLMLGDGGSLESSAVIIATGASALYLGIESEQKLRGHGVSACATCDGSLYRNVPVAVVGGGDTAMEEAMFLTRYATSVTVVHRRNEFRASKIMTARVLAHPKIRVAWDSVVDEVLDVSKGEVTGLRLRNVRSGAVSEIPVSGVFMAIGHAPNTSAFAGQVELDSKGYVVARGARTSVDGVFVAGDCHDMHYRQAITAAGFGCAAALEAERYLGSLGQ